MHQYIGITLHNKKRKVVFGVSHIFDIFKDQF